MNTCRQIALEQKSEQVCAVKITQTTAWIEKYSTVISKLICENAENNTKGVVDQSDIIPYSAAKTGPRKCHNIAMQRLKAKRFAVNESKCVPFSTFLCLFGYELSSDSMKPDLKHTDKLF